MSDSNANVSINLTTILKYASTAAFIISLTYYYFYFKSIGLDLGAAPITTEDIVSSYTHWGERVLIICLLIFLLDFISSKYALHKSDKKIIKSSRHQSFLLFCRQFPFYIFAVISGLGVLRGYLYGVNSPFDIYLTGFSCGYLSMVAAAKIFKYPYDRERITSLIEVPVIFLMLCLTVTATIAYLDGQYPTNQYKVVHLSPEKKISTSRCVRIFDRGILISQENENNPKIIFAPWGQVLSYSLDKKTATIPTLSHE